LEAAIPNAADPTTAVTTAAISTTPILTLGVVGVEVEALSHWPKSEKRKEFRGSFP